MSTRCLGYLVGWNNYVAELINYLGGDLEFTAEFGLIYMIARMT